jgi:hypothetical protein
MTPTLVSPELATLWLANTVGARPIDPALVDRYAQAMGDGTWDPNRNDPVCILAQGIIFDGQHRLAAIVQHGSPVLTNVTLNWEWHP